MEDIIYKKGSTIRTANILKIHMDDLEKYYTIFLPATKSRKARTIQTVQQYLFTLQPIQ